MKIPYASSHILTEPEASRYIRMSVSFLRQSRLEGVRKQRTPGPNYIKVGRAIRYLVSDLDAWLEAHRVAIISNSAELHRDFV